MYVTFEANGAAPPSISLGSVVTGQWNTMAPSQLTSYGSGMAFMLFSNNAGDTIGFRQTGQSFNGTGGCSNSQTIAMVPLDAAGRFDFWIGSTGHVPLLNLLGVLPSTDILAITPTAIPTTGAYVTKNLQALANAPVGAIAAIFHCPSIAGADFRLPGSSDSFKDTNEGSEWHSYIAPLNSGGNTQVTSSVANTAYAVAYLLPSSGLNWYDPGVNVNPSTAGSNQNIAQAPNDPSSGILATLYDFKVTASNHYALQIQGGTLAPTSTNASGNRRLQHPAAFPSEINMSSVTTATLYERGFFGPPLSYAMQGEV